MYVTLYTMGLHYFIMIFFFYFFLYSSSVEARILAFLIRHLWPTILVRFLFCYSWLMSGKYGSFTNWQVVLAHDPCHALCLSSVGTCMGDNMLRV